MLTTELQESRFMRAARRQPVDTTPIWIMRQAGRYLSEYMAIRNQVTFIELCKRPDLAAEATLVAQRVLGVDAAILFADLLPILEPMGLDLEYAPGEGPVIHNPLREATDVDRLQRLDSMDELPFVLETVVRVRRDLPANIPLIGFCGAPFTMASYAIEGGGSRHYAHTKRLMFGDPAAWHALMETLSSSLSLYLNAQIDSGCQAVQIFDSWAGCLAPSDFREYVLPHTRALIASVPDDVPVINFLTGNPALLPCQRDAGGDVIGVDWRIDLGAAWDVVGHDVAVQGNMDPLKMYGTVDNVRRHAQAVLESAGGRPGHIFNLGHGVLPDMPADNVKALVEIVHELGQAS